MNIQTILEKAPILEQVRAGTETLWLNPHKTNSTASPQDIPLTVRDIADAEARLQRFAPFLQLRFPETRARNGLIESPLSPIPNMQARLNESYAAKLPGRLLLKQDSHLAIAGSIKARGGIYEVLKHTEDLALEHGFLMPGDSYEKLADPHSHDFFSSYTIQVGSTGNLGMSIGIMAAAVGFHAVVHMSADARQWKKDLLRSHGVTVLEYGADYSEVVKQGRRLSDEDPRSYFVDDEKSVDLFLGYAVAARRLAAQLERLQIAVDGDHPLFVYLPCGVGGAPGGITFGLKQLYGENVHCFFVEPVQAPCMLAGMASGLHEQISVQDIGLTGRTHADGLAVGRPSGLVGRMMEHMLSGEFTVRDSRLYDYLRDLLETEGIFLEPSACAAFQGPARLFGCEAGRRYLDDNGLTGHMDQAVHIAWATGGNMVPEAVRVLYLATHLA